MRVFEITAAEKTKLDGMTPAEAKAYIETVYPYVDDMKNINAIYIRTPGRNLASTEVGAWESGTIKIADGTQFSDTTAIRTIDYIPIIGGKNYFFSVNYANGYTMGDFYSYWYDENKAYITFKADGAVATAPSNARYVRLAIRRTDRANIDANEVKNAQPMLNLGTTAAPYEVQKPSHLYFMDGLNLASNMDGSVADTLEFDGEGKPYATRRFKRMVLDGSQAWQLETDYVGFKRVSLPVSNIAKPVLNSGYCIKYNGKILSTNLTNTAYSAGDQLYVGNTLGIIITIDDADSGWTDAMTPGTTPLIKAYMNGWKLCSSTGGPYDGIATYYWKSVVDGTGITSDQNYVLNNYAPNFTPYQLQYQLSQSVTEFVPYDGELILEDGDNFVEVGAGVIVGEAVTPVSNGGFTRLNQTAFPESQFNNRVNSILRFYKSGKRETIYGTNLGQGWYYDSASTAYGNQRLTIGTNLYDPTAAYSVDYLALDTYKIGLAPITITGEVVPNIKEAVDDLTRIVVQAKADITAMQRGKAHKQQPQTIAPILVGGWSNGDENIGYVKYENGLVEFEGNLKGTGTNNTTVFYLPKELWPAKNKRYPIARVNDGVINSMLIVRVDGSVVLFSTGAFDPTIQFQLNCIFRAKQ